MAPAAPGPVEDSWFVEQQTDEIIRRRPTNGYVGLTLTEARALAASEERVVEDVTGMTVLTADYVPSRLRVRLDTHGRVETVEAG
jgi:hypothetical protein